MMGTVVAQEELAVFGCFHCFFYTSCSSFDLFDNGDSKRKEGGEKGRILLQSQKIIIIVKNILSQNLDEKENKSEKKKPRRIHNDLLKFQHNGAFCFLSIFIPFFLSWTSLQLLVTNQCIWLRSDHFAPLDSVVSLFFFRDPSFLIWRIPRSPVCHLISHGFLPPILATSRILLSSIRLPILTEKQSTTTTFTKGSCTAARKQPPSHND